LVFNSLTFGVFFIVVLALHYAPLPWRVKKINLVIASYLFYAAWNPPFILLLWLSTVVDWFMAKAIHREERTGPRRRLLIVSLALNLGMVAYFKYGEFALENWQALMAGFGVDYQPPAWDIVLPIGISFYTFVTLSYTLDVYLKRAAPAKSFLDFALFVTFFPHLVAGPIVRPIDLIPQFARPHVATRPMFLWGLALIILGLFEKIVIADEALAPAVEKVFGAEGGMPALDAWLGTMAFAGQIFCDFAGYSTIAIGTSLCLGFSLPTNFRFPYAAIGFSDFWRRWHISLSTWLRDYLYVPLGGSRKGPARTYVNLMITMLLGGLWHGANWTFVAWGGLHGLYLAVERFLRGRLARPGYRLSTPAALGLALLTYLAICFTWVFFRSETFAQAGIMVASMFGAHAGAEPVLPTIHVIVVSVITAAMLGVHFAMRERTIEGLAERTPAWALGGALGAMLLAIILAQGAGNAFIYFQF